ncbi:MAG: hypothetical protein Kow0088_20680 [Anaerolineales bacterium]
MFMINVGDSPYRVLVIEDDPALQGGIAEVLRAASMEVVEATNFQEALNLVKSNRPQLILISETFQDAQSGVLGDRLKTEALPRRPWVILIGTAETSSATQSAGLESGADSYLLRSIPMREFVARIESLASLQLLEEKASYLNRILRAIRNVNQLIVHEKDRQRLLQRACQILIESGGYFHAWIATLDQAGQVEMVVQAGLGAAFTEMRQRLLKGEFSAVERQALSQQEVVLIAEPATECEDCPLAGNMSGRAAMSISMRHEDRVYGLLNVSLPKEFLAEAEEQSLIHEVAGDLAFALYRIDLEEQQQQITAALRESEEKYRLLAETTQDIILVHDMQGNIQYVNQAGLDFAGFTAEETLGHSILDFLPPEYIPQIKSRQAARSAGEMLTYQYELEFIDRAGKRVPMAVLSTPFQRAGKAKEILVVARNISERKAAERQIQQRVEQLDALTRACQIVTASLDLDEVLHEIIDLAKRLTQADYSGIVLIDENGNIGAHAEDYIGYSSLHYRVRQNGITHWVLRHQKAAIGDFISQEGQIEPPFGVDAPQTINPALVNAAIRSFISLPLMVKGQNLGVLHLYSKQPRAFRQSEMLLTAFASQAAIAIDNAYQFHTAQQRLERLTSMHQIDKAISSSLDLRLTLDILVSQVITQLQVDAAAILLYRPESQSLQFVAGQGFKTSALQHSEIRLGHSFAGVAALERRVVSVDNSEKLSQAFARSLHFRDEGFQSYLGVPLIAKGNVIGVLEIYHRQHLEPSAEWMAFLEALAGQAAIAIENARLFEDLQNINFQLLQAYDATIEGWAKALEFRDLETEGHSRRVVELTLKLAQRLGVDDQQLPAIRRGALLHDIGKMAIPDALLQKPGPLNEEEWKLMRQHPLFARQMLENIPFLHSALEIPYSHHEKWDGSGYPLGLKGNEIPLAARIFAVVDVWDALTNDRPYRKAWTQKQALEYLSEQKGKHFDPKVVDAFLLLLNEQGFSG